MYFTLNKNKLNWTERFIDVVTQINNMITHSKQVDKQIITVDTCVKTIDDCVERC